MIAFDKLVGAFLHLWRRI